MIKKVLTTVLIFFSLTRSLYASYELNYLSTKIINNLNNNKCFNLVKSDFIHINKLESIYGKLNQKEYRMLLDFPETYIKITRGKFLIRSSRDWNNIINYLSRSKLKMKYSQISSAARVRLEPLVKGIHYLFQMQLEVIVESKNIKKNRKYKTIQVLVYISKGKVQIVNFDK